MTSLSVVIPVYRSADSLPELIGELARVLPALAPSSEIILVDDGSPDGTWQVVQHLTARHAAVRGISLMRNYGQHNALLCGIRAARNEIVVTMDDDLQHPPSEIVSLLARLEEGYDVVYGCPVRQRHGLWRNIASYMTKVVLQASMGVEVARQVSAFRALRTELRKAFADYDSPFVSIDVLLTWGTTRFAAVTVSHNERKYAKSHYTFRKLVTHAVNMVTGFSILPLQIASVSGFAFTLFGMLVFMYVVVRYLLQGTPVPGFPFLASIIAIFSGAQLFALGVIGEYIARIHFRTMDRPIYTVRRTTD